MLWYVGFSMGKKMTIQWISLHISVVCASGWLFVYCTRFSFGLSNVFMVTMDHQPGQGNSQGLTPNRWICAPSEAASRLLAATGLPGEWAEGCEKEGLHSSRANRQGHGSSRSTWEDKVKEKTHLGPGTEHKRKVTETTQQGTCNRNTKRKH